MRARLAGLWLLALAPAACTTPPPAYAINLPGVNINVGGDVDVWAINISQWAFADSGRTAGRPVEAARAAAAVEYLTVALDAPRWAGMSPITKMEMQTARAELRRALGVPADAAPQPVIQSLLDCANALAAGDPGAAATALRTPYFAFGPERSLGVLAAMPYLRNVNIATMHAGLADPNGSGGGIIWNR